MERLMKGLLLVSIGCVLFLFQGSPALARREVPVTPDPVYAAFPAYRIDDRMQRISIIGSGTGSEELRSALTKFLTERTEIKVVEPGNLQSVLAGKVIEYHTGIAPSDAQVLSRMFQIDHLLLFDVEMAPYSAYRFGGRDYALQLLADRPFVCPKGLAGVCRPGSRAGKGVGEGTLFADPLSGLPAR